MNKALLALSGGNTGIHTEKVAILNKTVSILTYSSLLFGPILSFVHHKGLISISQILEIGVMLRFLIGSYTMVKDRRTG